MTFVINFKKDMYTNIYSYREKKPKCEVVECVGKGHYGIVYKVVDIKHFRTYVVKISSIDEIANNNEVEKYLQLIEIHKYENYFPKIYGIYKSKKNIFILMKYINGGCLRKSLIRKYNLDFYNIRDIIMNIMFGLKIFHNLGMVFNDVKPDNILFEKKTLLVKIVDMGFVNGSGNDSNLSCGTPLFFPKEIFSLLNTGCKKDVWALGFTIHYFIFGYIPSENFIMFDNKESDKILFDDKMYHNTLKVMNEDYKRLKKRLGKEEAELLKDFVFSCIIKDHNKRPEINSLFNHNIFKR